MAEREKPAVGMAFYQKLHVDIHLGNCLIVFFFGGGGGKSLFFRLQDSIDI